MRVEEQTPEEKVIESNKQKPLRQPMDKLVILAILTVASMTFFWFTVYKIFESDLEFSFNAEIIVTVVFAVVAFSLMFAVVGISEVLVERKFLFFLVLIAGSLTHFIFFPITIPNDIAAFLMFLGFWIWKRSVHGDMENRIKFSTLQVIPAGIGVTITLMLLSVSFTYYAYLAFDDGSERLLSGVTDTIVTSVDKMLPNYISNYDPNMTLDAFIQQSMEMSALSPSLPTDSLFGEAIEEGLQSAQGAVLEESRREFLGTFDITADGSETMAGIVKKIVTRRIDMFITPFKKFIPAVLSLSLFFILRIFGFVYKPLIQIFSYLFYKVLLVTRFIRVGKIIIEKERLEFT